MGRRIAWTITIVAVVLLAGLAWLGVTAWQIRSDLAAAQSQVTGGRRQLTAGQTAQAADSLRAADRHLAAASAAAQRFPWTLAGSLPGPGRWAAQTSATLQAASDLSGSLQPLVDVIGDANPQTLVVDGRIDAAYLERVSDAVTAAAPGVESATRRLGWVDTGALPGSLGEQVTALAAQARGVNHALQSARRVLPLLPAAVGSDGPRRYLMMFQNPTEVRGTGGLLGSFALVEFAGGTPKVLTQGPNQDLPNADWPVRALPPDSRQWWGADATYLWGFNMTANFPYAAANYRLQWRKLGKGQVDTVVGLDQYVVAALLAGTGPVTVQGITVSSGNAVDFLTKDVYARFPDSVAKDQFVSDLLSAIVKQYAVASPNVLAMAQALAGPVSDSRLFIWSRKAAEQQVWADSVVGGQIPTAAGPTSLVTFNNGSGTKLDAYLKASATYTVGDCGDTERKGSVEVKLTNDSPAGLPPYVDARNPLYGKSDFLVKNPGSNITLAYVYGPVGSYLDRATLDGEPVAVPQGTERDHTVWRFDVPLKQGQSATLRLDFIEPVTGPARWAEPQLIVRPIVQPIPTRVSAGAPCSIEIPE